MSGYRVPANAPVELGRPLWGYSRISVESLCKLWSAYREGLLRMADLRTWFAVHELLARRCNLPKGRVPRYTVEEASSISALSIPKLKASVDRLTRLGFLAWSTTGVRTLSGTEATLGALTGHSSMVAAVPNSSRVLPVPRHTVLLLARCRRPVLFATVLGQLFRCVYYRSRMCASWGRCKSSWIATAFAVDVRNVKAARQELEARGWMRQVASNHWQRQRYGAAFVVSLQWDSRQDNGVATPLVSPPRNSPIAKKSPPPDVYRNLPEGIKHQNRVERGRAGVQGQGKGEGTPRLLHVVPADLTNPSRTVMLFREALRAGLVANTPSERLKFFAAAERAKRVARNPGAFFVAVLRKRLWHHISDRDEEPARRTLPKMPDFFFGESTVSPHVTDHREGGMLAPTRQFTTRAAEDREAIRDTIRRSLDQAVGAASAGTNVRTVAKNSSGSAGMMSGVQPNADAFAASSAPWQSMTVGRSARAGSRWMARIT